MYGQTEATARMTVLPPALAAAHPGSRRPPGARRADARGPGARAARRRGRAGLPGPERDARVRGRPRRPGRWDAPSPSCGPATSGASDPRAWSRSSVAQAVSPRSSASRIDLDHGERLLARHGFVTCAVEVDGSGAGGRRGRPRRGLGGPPGGRGPRAPPRCRPRRRRRRPAAHGRRQGRHRRGPGPGSTARPEVDEPVRRHGRRPGRRARPVRRRARPPGRRRRTTPSSVWAGTPCRTWPSRWGSSGCSATCRRTGTSRRSGGCGPAVAGCPGCARWRPGSCCARWRACSSWRRTWAWSACRAAPTCCSRWPGTPPPASTSTPGRGASGSGGCCAASPGSCCPPWSGSGSPRCCSPTTTARSTWCS